MFEPWFGAGLIKVFQNFKIVYLHVGVFGDQNMYLYFVKFYLLLSRLDVCLELTYMYVDVRMMCAYECVSRVLLRKKLVLNTSTGATGS